MLRLLCFVDVEQTSAPQPAKNSQLDRVSYRLEIGAVWERELVKDDIRSLRRATEDAVRHGDMVVDVEVEAAAKALGKADSAAADGRGARGLCLSRWHERRPKLLALPAPDFSHEDATDGAQRSGAALSAAMCAKIAPRSVRAR